MYQPTPGDLALRAAAAGLMGSVLGRVKEFTTLFAQAGLLRFDTDGFVTAVAKTAVAAANRNKNLAATSSLAASGGGPSGSYSSGSSSVAPGGGRDAKAGGEGSQGAVDEKKSLMAVEGKSFMKGKKEAMARFMCGG